MKRIVTMTLALGLCAGLAACDKGAAGGGNAAAAADPAAEKQAVEAQEQAMLAAFKAKDANALASHYAPDAVAANAGEAPMTGGDQIRNGVTAMLKDPAFSLDFANEKTDVAASGDLAYTRGTFHVGYTDPTTKKPIKVDGSYLTVFRKQADGSWKAVADFSTPGAAKAA